MLDVMIDLETLSTRADAVIAQIGVVGFNRHDRGAIRPGIQVRVDPQSCLDLGMKVDWSTLAW